MSDSLSLIGISLEVRHATPLRYGASIYGGKDETRLYKRGASHLGGARKSTILKAVSDSKMPQEKNYLCPECNGKAL